jgi:hypothetical protein
MRDIGVDAGIAYVSCRIIADGDHFKFFLYEELYFNPVNTRLMQTFPFVLHL